MKRLQVATIRSVVDGTDKSAFACVCRFLLSFVSVPYSLVVRLRGRLFDLGVLGTTRAARPVVSIGNLTLGGVGKTPFVGWLTDVLERANHTPGLISRGYRNKEQSAAFSSSETIGAADSFARYEIFNDEARELALRFPSTPHFLGAKRVEVAEALLTKRPDVDAILLDDAFQHRRIARDLNVVLLDALNPFGGGRVFPAGYLREPISGLKRADVVLLNRADLVDETARVKIRSRVAKIVPRALWGEIAQRPRDVFRRRRDAQIERIDVEKWRESTRGRRFVAFCGLGAPAGFKATLEREGLDVASFLAFPDHYVYAQDDFRRLREEASRVGADAFVTTIKDFVKLEQFVDDAAPAYALGIGVEFLSGEADFRRALFQIFAKQ